jgi:pimeloyl-ACP methyl ester carboxylesterase
VLEVIVRGHSTDDHPATLLFVHGGWHAAWCWDEHFLNFFAEKGFRAAAVSLRGHGKSDGDGDGDLNFCSVTDYVDDVRSVAKEFDSPVVVVGHSMGGYVVQKYLESNDAPAGILMASAPPQGAMSSSLRMVRRHPLAVMKVNVLGQTDAVVNTRRLARAQLFCRQTPQAIVDNCLRRLQSESALAMKQLMSADGIRPESVTAPVLVLGADEDGLFNRDEVIATARTYRTDARFFPAMGHDMMLEPGWRDVADHIQQWLVVNGL